MKWSYDFMTSEQVPIELQSRWREQVELCGNFFQFPEIVATWCETLGQQLGGNLIVIYSKSDSGHEMILPLWSSVQSLYSLRRKVLEGIGGAIQYDYQDPIPLSGEWSEQVWYSFWRNFIEKNVSQFDKLGMIKLQRLSVPVPEELRRIFHDQGKAPYLNLPEGKNSLENILAACGSSHRSNVRRRMRDAAKVGDVRLEKIEGASLQVSLEKMYQAHIAQWNERSMRSQFENRAFREFFRRLCSVGQDMGKLYFTRLSVGGEVWNWLVAFVHRGELIWYKPTYEIAYKKYSPGLVHLACLIQEAGQEGIVRIDFGYGGESYKFLWASEVKSLQGICYLHDDPFLTAARRLHYYFSRYRAVGGLAGYISKQFSRNKK